MITRVEIVKRHEYLDRVDIWLLHDLPNRDVQVIDLEGEVKTRYSRGQAMGEPSFSVTPSVLEMIIAKAIDFKPPSSALQDHLKDAITVRDRLLAIVEKGTNGR